MADLALRAVVEGAQKAQQDIGAIADSVNKAATTDQEWAQIQQRLTQVGVEVRAEHEKRAKALQELRDHTADVVKRTQEQIAVEEQAKATVSEFSERLVGFATRWLSVGTVVATVVNVMREAKEQGQQAAEANIKLEAVLRATGAGAGFTAQQLQGMAQQLGRVAAIQDTAITQAIATLLTFQNVQGETFRQGLALAVDYSRLWGGDVVTATRAVGRALEDPVHGLTLLRRAGVAVNETTKEHIQSLTDQGRLMEAQGVIIDLMRQKFGGLAQAIGMDAVSATARLSVAWNNLMQDLGKVDPDSFTSRWSRGATRILEAMDKLVTGETWRELKLLSLYHDANQIKDLERAKAGSEQLALIAKELNKSLSDEGSKRIQAQKNAEERAAEESARAQLEAIRKMGSSDDLKKLQDQYAKLSKFFVEGVSTEVQEAALEKLLEIEKRIGDKTRTERQKRFHEEEAYYKDLITLGAKRSDDLIALYERESRTVGISIQERTALEARASHERTKQATDAAKAQTAVEEMAAHDTAEAWKFYFEAKDKSRKMDQKAQSEAATLEIEGIQHTIFWTREGMIAALKERRQAAVETAGEESEAVKKYDRAIERLPVTTDDAARRIKQTFGNLAFDSITVFTSMHSALQNSIANVMKGTESLGQGIKNFFKGTVDSIINDLSRLSANQILGLLFDIDPMTGKPVQGALGGVGGGILSVIGGGIGQALGLPNLGSSIAEFLGFGGGGGPGIFGPVGAAAPEGGAIAASFAAEAAAAAAAESFGIGELLSFAFGVFQTGTDQIVTRPTLAVVGEAGPERLRVQPLAGVESGGGGVTVNFNGLTMMDNYSARRLALEISDMIR